MINYHKDWKILIIVDVIVILLPRRRVMNKEELLNYQLDEDDFEITMDGVLIKYNSNILKKILQDQKLANELKTTHEFYLESKNGFCAGVTSQILALSNRGGSPKKEWLTTKEGRSNS